MRYSASWLPLTANERKRTMSNKRLLREIEGKRYDAWPPYSRKGESRCLTPEDWRHSRAPTGRCSEDWVYPERENRTRADWPYSYSDHFLWRDGSRESLKDAHAEYSDRMQQWDGDKWRGACAEAPRTQVTHWGQDACTKFLTAYFGRPVTACALSEGCNVSSGYPYWVFWFRDVSR